MLGKTEGRRRREQQRTRCLDGITDTMDMSLSKIQEMGKEWGAWGGLNAEMGGAEEMRRQ